MKYLIFLLLIGISPEIVLGQSNLGQKCRDKISIQNSRSNFVYPGDNYVTIALPGISIDSCVVSIESQYTITIKKVECNSFILHVNRFPIIDPEQMPIPEFLVIVKNFNDEVLGQQKFFIYDFPPPLPMLDNRYSGGDIVVEKFIAQKALTTVMDYHTTRLCHNCEVISFSLIRITKDKLTTIAQNQGTYFQKEIAEIIRKAESGDMYIFSDILSKCPWSISNEKLSDNLTFHITDQ